MHVTVLSYQASCCLNSSVVAGTTCMPVMPRYADCNVKIPAAVPLTARQLVLTNFLQINLHMRPRCWLFGSKRCPSYQSTTVHLDLLATGEILPQETSHYCSEGESAYFPPHTPPGRAGSS